MKYLKLFEDLKVKEELIELIPELDDLCQDLKDHRYDIMMTDTRTSLIKGEGKLFTFQFNNAIDCLMMRIDKYNDFKIDDIFINNILFIESYATDELGLKINFYYVKSSYFKSDSDIKYYTNIEDLPRSVKVNNIQICFIKA